MDELVNFAFYNTNVFASYGVNKGNSYISTLPEMRPMFTTEPGVIKYVPVEVPQPIEEVVQVPVTENILNWAENHYNELFPGLSTTQDIEGYQARMYENGQAAGSMGDNMYYFDGETIHNVGTVDHWAELATL